MAHLAGDGGLWPSAARARSRSTRRRGRNSSSADGTESIFLADMSGDGLTDLVRIRVGEVCYWPNLGYGRFGAKVTIDGASRFDRAELFDAHRVYLADIDGSGTADIIYFAARRDTPVLQPIGQRRGCAARAEPLPEGRQRVHSDGARPFGQRHGVFGVVVAAERRTRAFRCAIST